jgi:hypothetical protein
VELEELYSGSFIDWERVASSWAKRTPSSRLMLFAARRYLEESNATAEPGREEVLDSLALPDEVCEAFVAPPQPEEASSRRWGEFIDGAVAAELEMVSYGERPPILHELKGGLEEAAAQAGEESELGRWFLGRRDALPGGDLPDDPEFLPV